MLTPAGRNWWRVLPEKTFTAMIAGVREAAMAQGLTEAEAFDRGIADLLRTTAADGVFCYTFFKAVGVRDHCSGQEDAMPTGFLLALGIS